ncbi:KRAB [Mytilus edulis]|uniref:KRAB n=1 Tax=Mytilus edulis TaxID=6550 RepID=A0A8S3PQH7_MYTED|nr:KRAB [Mytilus edulis]
MGGADYTNFMGGATKYMGGVDYTKYMGGADYTEYTEEQTTLIHGGADYTEYREEPTTLSTWEESTTLSTWEESTTLSTWEPTTLSTWEVDYTKYMGGVDYTKYMRGVDYTLSTWEERTTLSTWEERTTLSTWEESTTLSTWEKPTTLSTWEEPTTLNTWEESSYTKLFLLSPNHQTVGNSPAMTFLTFSRQMTSSLIDGYVGISNKGRQAAAPVQSRLTERHMPNVVGNKSWCHVCRAKVAAGRQEKRRQTIYGCNECGKHFCLPHKSKILLIT